MERKLNYIREGIPVADTVLTKTNFSNLTSAAEAVFHRHAKGGSYRCELSFVRQLFVERNQNWNAAQHPTAHAIPAIHPARTSVG
jgi:hypothetical protein